MANAVWPSAKQRFLSGSLDLTTGTIEVMALSAAYTYNPAHAFLSDLTGTIQASGQIGGISVAQGIFAASPATLAAVGAGQTIVALAGFKNTGTATTSPLIWFDDSLHVLTNGGNVTADWGTFIFEIPGSIAPAGNGTLHPAGIAAIDVLGGTFVSAPGSPGVPIINVVSPNASSNKSGTLNNGQLIATLTASNSPVTWAIVSPTGHFAINNSGQLTVTSSGVTSLIPARTGAVETVLVTASNGSGTSAAATIRVTCWPDGALDAPTGTPQVPTLFAPYGRRPPWKVAGVDYYVGLPTGTSLGNPTTGTLPSGASYSSHTVTISGSGVVFEGWDMSVSGGIGLSIQGPNAVVRNNKFVMGANLIVPILVLTGGSNSHIYNNYLDGGSAEDAITFGGVVYVVATDALGMTIEYNELKFAGSDFICCGGGTNINRFNLMTQDGMATGPEHPDFVQSNPFSLPTTYTPQMYFNTWVNTYGVVHNGGQGGGIGDNSCPVVGAACLDNNVMIANGPGNPGADLVSISYWAIIDPTSFQTGASATCANNWADITSAYGFGYGGGSSSRSVFSNNQNLVDGSFFSNTP